MTTEETTEPKYIDETWMFAGSRLLGNGSKKHAWLPLPADGINGELLYSPKGSFTVGSEYNMPVKRDGDHIWINRGNVRYLRQHENADLRALVEARHKGAETEIRVKRMESADKRNTALDAAVAPLVELSKSLRPMERTAFLAYVIQQVTKPW